MNFLDIIVLIPVLWGAFKGFKNGLISEAGSIASLILGIWAALTLSDKIAPFVAKFTAISEGYQQITAFAITFVLVLILCYIITRIIIGFCKAINILWLDKLLGVLFGMSKYLIILSFIFYLTNTLVKSYATKPVEVIENSVLFKPMAETAESFASGSITIPTIEKPSFFDPFKQNNDED